jgi:fermentation-respiration switch protein FrsA (DUF1100 family)
MKPLCEVWNRRTGLLIALALVWATAASADQAPGAAFTGPLGPFEKSTLNPGVRSEATPAEVGVAFERVAIPSSGRILDGFLVRADRSCAPATAVLIFHGRGETIADWVKVQKYLHSHCVSSLVFDYAGHGHSTGVGTVDHLNEDAVAADTFFLAAFQSASRRCLLSHSLGGGPMLFAATQPSAHPDCVVAANPFSSLREMAALGGMPKAQVWAISDVWDNVDRVKQLDAPLLWVASRADTTIPIALGEEVYEAKPERKASVTLDGFSHNAIYLDTPDAIWTPILAFVKGSGRR